MVGRLPATSQTSFLNINPDDIEQDDIVAALLLRLLSATVIDDPAAARERRDAREAPPHWIVVDYSLEEVLHVCQQAEKSFMKQEMLLELEKQFLPLHVVADLHGQVAHLFRMFRTLGSPQKETYLFLGDYVDRGVQGIPLILLLFCLKIRYPFQVYLLRGNHEDVNTNLNYGFYEECLLRFKNQGERVWLAFLSAFNCMPMAALISGKESRIFCCHGGISPFINRLEDIKNIQRPLIIPAYGIACDLVWADPGVVNGWSLSPRGISFNYGTDILEAFCKQHNIDIILRGHQINDKMYRSGYKMSNGGRLITFFSAPNYMNYKNNGCVIKISENLRLSFIIFRVSNSNKSASLPAAKKSSSSTISGILGRVKNKKKSEIKAAVDKEGEIDTEVDVAFSRESMDAAKSCYKPARSTVDRKEKSLYGTVPDTNNNKDNTKSGYQSVSVMGSSYQPTTNLYQTNSNSSQLAGQPLSSFGQAPADKSYFEPVSITKPQSLTVAADKKKDKSKKKSQLSKK